MSPKLALKSHETVHFWQESLRDTFANMSQLGVLIALLAFYGCAYHKMMLQLPLTV